MEFVAKVIKFGRVTIPVEIRKIENISEGDFVRVVVEKVRRSGVAICDDRMDEYRNHGDGD